MPTTDLVADYGAVGDGQHASVTGSLSSGASPVLTPATPVFSSGDVGKAIVVYGPGFAYPSSGSVITISSYNAGTGAVTLTGTNSTLRSSVAMEIIWGTDNTTAFMAYRTWAQGLGSDQAHLTIPDGHYCANIGPLSPLNLGVKNSLITGASGNAANCIISKCYSAEMRLGGDVSIVQNRGLTHASATMARLNSTTAGATTATLVDKVGYGSRITIGADCIIHGYDTQSVGSGSFGYPPNPYFYEVNKITDYADGTITLQNPLAYAYMSDWPVWSTSSSVTDQGGAATIYVLTDYDRTVEIRDITLLSPSEQIACHGREVILRNVIMPGYGVYPTMNANYEAHDCEFVVQLEVDKIVGAATFNNCTGGILKVQSSSPNTLTVTSGEWRQITGSAKNLIVDGLTLTGAGGSDKQILLGLGYGRTSSASLRNIVGLNNLADSGSANPGIHNGGFSSTMPMTDGVFSFLYSENDGFGGQQNPGANLVPGTWLSLDDKLYIQIQRVWGDGTTIYHQTNLTGDWPFSFTNARAHPCPDFTMSNCTGADAQLEDYNQAPPRIPYRSYSKRTYTDDATGTTAKTVVPVIGRLQTAKFTVTPTGSVTFNASAFGNNIVYKGDYTTAVFAPTINMAHAGTRTMTGNSATAGAQTGDTFPDLTSLGHIWFRGNPFNGPVFSTNNTNAVIVVEYIMDHGIPPVVPTAVVPLRLRLRAA